MRSFYAKIMEDFHLYSGLRSSEKLSDEEATKLLDILCRVSKNYEYIPKEEQQKIIEAQLIADRTYYNLNARTVAGWLELNGKKYFKEEAHQSRLTEEDYTPLEGEARDRAIQEYLNAIAKAETNFTQAVKGNGSRMREQFNKVAPIPQTEPSALEDACAKTGDYAEEQQHHEKPSN